MRAGALPLWLGSPHPTVMILEQDGVCRVRRLTIDPVVADAARTRALAAGEPWMPEQYYALGQPTGELVLEAATKDELADLLAVIDWPESW